ncbi:hypothetical protein SAMN05216474_2203 [Lishizhenia tianjinensis]|uniref:Uncharacterized protein n=1 Tax=Lishizhenia tianjinensis TaxID=477690 RepID=A0A1I7ALH6_9FLAO|nr:hypothetical protein [Lishizhenia tianjinensis]SFT75760.1 hypothetical protein SAMN05216474_2203 [Lishizhenia tianjinensis]
MHFIEPHFSWRDYYVASEDAYSPFFEREYSEFEFSDALYNFAIHPQWDNFGSPTLFMKILYADYEIGFCIIEFIGEWNDAINNDIMTLKRDIIEHLMQNGIDKFIIIGENVLNFHYSDDSYYEEWFDELEDGWIAMVNFHDHVLEEFKEIHLDQFFVMGGELEDVSWRTYNPIQFYGRIEQYVQKRLM